MTDVLDFLEKLEQATSVRYSVRQNAAVSDGSDLSVVVLDLPLLKKRSGHWQRYIEFLLTVLSCMVFSQSRGTSHVTTKQRCKCS